MSRLCLSVALLVFLGTLVAGTPEGGDSLKENGLRPAFCLQPPYTGPCRATLPRGFYHAASGLCQRFTGGGCRRKPNDFRDGEAGVGACGPRRGAGKDAGRAGGEGLGGRSPGAAPPPARRLASSLLARSSGRSVPWNHSLSEFSRDHLSRRPPLEPPSRESGNCAP